MSLPLRLLLLPALVSLLLLGEAQGADYVAVFLGEDAVATCLKILPGGLSLRQYCEHSTIIYDPSNIHDYDKYLNKQVSMEVIGGARDEHQSALMVSYEQTELLSTNTYPHITVASQDHYPYTPVYSSILWERVVKARSMTVHLSPDHKPQSLELPGGKEEWVGFLPEDGKYAQTSAVAYVGGLQTRAVSGTPVLTGTICYASKWKDGVCVV